mgnify:CR=1 FL=1
MIQRIVQKMEENAEGGLAYSGKCYICQSECMDDAKAVAMLVESRFPNLNGKLKFIRLVLQLAVIPAREQ